jgi:hypothetical protein
MYSWDKTSIHTSGPRTKEGSIPVDEQRSVA